MSEGRHFSREFKLSALSRMRAGENVSASARELGIRRKLLYDWRDAFHAGGEETLRRRGRPRKGTPVVGARSAMGIGAKTAPLCEPDTAERRIAELERKVGRQALEADFLKQARQLLESFRPDSAKAD